MFFPFFSNGVSSFDLGNACHLLSPKSKYSPCYILLNEQATQLFSAELGRALPADEWTLEK